MRTSRHTAAGMPGGCTRRTFHRTVSALGATARAGVFLGALVTPHAYAGQTVEPLAPIYEQMFACAPFMGGVSRVSDGPAQASKCCSSQSHCVDELPTTILPHPSLATHT